MGSVCSHCPPLCVCEGYHALAARDTHPQLIIVLFGAGISQACRYPDAIFNILVGVRWFRVLSDCRSVRVNADLGGSATDEMRPANEPVREINHLTDAATAAVAAEFSEF